MAKNLYSEIINFISELPTWQRLLAAYILDIQDIDEEQAIEESYRLLLGENELGILTPVKGLVFPDIPPSDKSAGHEPVKLVAVKNFVNVNAIRSGQTLPVGDNGITTLGGLNGSGKSSIGRILNCAFYSRGEDEVIPNIFVASDGLPASVTLVFQRADKTVYELQYVNDGTLNKAPELGQFASFDTKCVNVHLNEENELHIAPQGFHFFRELADLTNLVLHRLGDEIGRASVENHFFDGLLGDSATKLFLKSLNWETQDSDVREHLQFDESDLGRAQMLRNKLSEMNIEVIRAKRRFLSDVRGQILTLKIRVASAESAMRADVLNTLEEGIVRIVELNTLLREQGSTRFQYSSVKGIGTLSWKQFIQNGQKVAGLQHGHYPASDDVCIFCAQKLSDDSAAHIRAYWELLGSTAESDLNKVKASLREKLGVIDTLNLNLLDETSALSRWMEDRAPTYVSSVKDVLGGLDKNRHSLKSNLADLTWQTLDPVGSIDFQVLLDMVDTELAATEIKTLLEQKVEVEKELLNLTHREVVSENVDSILAWLAKRKWAEKAAALRDNLSTRSVTETGKRLFDEHVTKQYKQMFQQECTELNARFRLEMTQKGRGGKAHRKYAIEGYPPGKILSEGEQRAVSLADFITELKISGINSGWVFDDPVNSQDVERKDLIAKKLVMEAKDRQVIVFSHDITFLYDLYHWSVRLGVPFKQNWVERLGFDAGIIHEDIPPNFEAAYIQPDRAENKLSEAKEPKLDPMERETRIREGFSCLRTSYEAFVIQKMLAKVVTRFDRKMGYEAISEIYAPPKWRSLILNKLKEISVYIEGHSHSDIGYKPVTPELLSAEIEQFKTMNKDFDADRKAEVKSLTDQSAKV